MQDIGYLNINENVLIQYIYDDTFLYAKDYNIIKDTLNSEYTYTSGDSSDANNNTDLFLLDKVNNKYGIVNYSERAFLQKEEHINAPITRYDKVRIYFPTNYNFTNSVGFHVNIAAYNNTTTKLYNLSNFYFDKTQSSHLAKMQLASTPVNFAGKVFGKYIELLIPSTYVESRNRANNRPIPGTINYNLTGGITSIGLSENSPIFITFKFIESKGTTMGYTTYTLSKPYMSSITQYPNFQGISMKVEHSSDGDYFLVYPEFNGSQAEFVKFMNMLEETGNRSYCLYTITLYENMVATDSVDIYKYQDFDTKIKYRPIFMLSNTTASIKVDLKIVNTVDNSVTNKSTDYTLLNSDILKYGKTLTKLNLDNVIKPKVYNAKPENLVISNTMALNMSRRVQIQTQVQTNTVTKVKTVPVLMDTYNLIARNSEDITLSGVTYSAQNSLEIVLKPFDNVVKLRIAENIGSDNVVKPYSIPTNNAEILLNFRSDKKDVSIPLYTQSNEIDLGNGVVIFNISESNNEDLKTIRTANPNFYVTLKTDIGTNVLYTGKFIFADSPEYIARTKNTNTNNNTNTNTNNNNNVNRNASPYTNQSNNNNVTVNPGAVSTGNNTSVVPDVSGPVNVNINPLYSIGLSPLQYTLIL